MAAGLLARITETAVRLEDRDTVEFSRQLAAELLETVAGPPIIAPSPRRGRPGKVMLEIQTKKVTWMTVADLQAAAQRLSPADLESTRTKLAELIDRQSRYLGVRTPELAMMVLGEAARPAAAVSPTR